MKHARRISLFAAAVLLAAGSARVAFTFAGARVTGPATWKDVDRLVSEQKFEEAASAVGKIREAARAAGDESDEAKALVREVQLRTALHGYETSVRFLKDQPWPKGLLPRTTLRLFYAQSLVTYAQAYGWEIGKREKVSSTGAVDLKAWTRDAIESVAFKDDRFIYEAEIAVRAGLAGRRFAMVPITYFNRYGGISGHGRGWKEPVSIIWTGVKILIFSTLIRLSLW